MSRKTDRPANPTRRTLLQVGAAGVTAAFGSKAVSLGALAQQTTAPQQTPPAGPPPLVPAVPPPAAGLIDPTALTAETWCEAWTWRPAEWPGQSLDLNVVERNEPAKAPTPGQVFPGQFSFAGISPAPTIRVRTGGTIRIRLRNLLGPNFGRMWVGPCPDPPSLTPALTLEFQKQIAKAEGKPAPTELDPTFNPFLYLEELGTFLGVKFMEGHCMTHVSNSAHGSRVTNIHTHGLHVSPGANPGGRTESDNVLVRLMSKEDWAARQKAGGCGTLSPHEHVGHVDYEITLGNVQRAATQRAGRPPQNDPPGTHWYHPHAHGSTHDQVSSGMAGFLIVEGDVDDAINTAMTGGAKPDPVEPAGKFDYRERLVFVQRAIVPSIDGNAPGSRRQRLSPDLVPPEGIPSPTVMFMRPGAVERWRVLNGSVDGRGFKRFMVLNGQYVSRDNALWRVDKTEGTPPERKLVQVTRADVEAAKLPLYQLAFDGITLVTVENGRARHTIKDLSKRNAGTQNPLARPFAAGENAEEAILRNWEACFRDGASIRNAFVRPNEVWMAPANRADVFFKAPIDATGKVLTLLAQEELLHTDNFQGRQQRRVLGRQGFGGGTGNPAPMDVVIAHVTVRGTAVEGGDFDVMSLRDKLPPVPPFLQPVSDDETRMTPEEARLHRAPAGSHRTRAVSYSGYGSAAFPLIEVPEAFAKAHPELRNLLWAEHDGTRVLLAPNGRTMAINNQFDLAKNPNPPPPKKFSPNHPDRIRPLVNTAEEWVLYNPTVTLWAHTDLQRFPQKGQMLVQYRSYPVNRAEGQARFWRDHEFRTMVHGADHPFHIHVNPMWVTRIEVPDEQGRLHNLLEEPKWMDTVSIPRNGGRVVFRSRFADFTGKWIHHCHILMHEDMGMMQEVECVATAAAANPNPKATVASHSMTEAEVNAIYPRPSVDVAYRQNLMFDDPNPVTGQQFPGFELEVPKLTD